MDYKDYQNSRNASWDILLATDTKDLPVRITSICKQLGIDVLPFSKRPVMHQLAAQRQTGDHLDGFSVYVDDRPTIFYDDTQRSRRCRFTLAHELGHFVRGHVGKDDTHILYRSEADSEDSKEQAANVFARDTLAPACVLWGLGVTTKEQIYTMCDITITAAKIRMERMELLYARERHFLETKGYSCFLQNPGERKVYEQFKPYIEANRL